MRQKNPQNHLRKFFFFFFFSFVSLCEIMRKDPPPLRPDGPQHPPDSFNSNSFQFQFNSIELNSIQISLNVSFAAVSPHRPPHLICIDSLPHLHIATIENRHNTRLLIKIHAAHLHNFPYANQQRGFFSEFQCIIIIIISLDCATLEKIIRLCK